MSYEVACSECGHEWLYTGKYQPEESRAYLTCSNCRERPHLSEAIEARDSGEEEERSAEAVKNDKFINQHAREIFEETLFSRRQSEVIALRELQFQSTEQIAERLDINVPTVRSHEQKIEEKLEEAQKTLSYADDALHLKTGRGYRKMVEVPFRSGEVIQE